MRSLLARRRDASGASAIEFGLILPLLVLLLLGIIDYGFIFYTRLNMTNAAREGARVGVTQGTPAAAVERAKIAACNYLVAAGLGGQCAGCATSDSCVTVTPPVAGPDAEVAVQVAMTNDQYFTLRFAPQPASMSVTATMRWELAQSSEPATP